MIRKGAPATVAFAVPPSAQGPPIGVPVKVHGPGAVSLTTSWVRGAGLSVGNVRSMGPVAAQAVLEIARRLGAAVDAPFPEPDTVRANPVLAKNRRLTLPENGIAWALLARASVTRTANIGTAICRSGESSADAMIPLRIELPSPSEKADSSYP
jgi:hypothetical protein